MGFSDIFKTGEMRRRISELETENRKLKSTINQLNEELEQEKRSAAILFNIQNVNLSLAYVHPDLRGLLYATDEDPPKDNAYEPSMIYKGEAVIPVKDINTVPLLPYWPSYLGITPEQRFVYLKALQTPYDATVDIGYIFLLYYGLERQLYEGDFDKAFNVIMKLRDVHSNSSFQSYSANALLMSAMMKQRMDKLEEFYASLEARDNQGISTDLYVLLKAFIGRPFTLSDLINNRRYFFYDKKTYMNSRYDEFMNELSITMKDFFGTTEVDLSPMLDNIKKAASDTRHPYANLSLGNVTCNVPDLCTVNDFKAFCTGALTIAHENLKNSRSKKQEKKIEKPKERVLKYTVSYMHEESIFDENEEAFYQALLAELIRQNICTESNLHVYTLSDLTINFSLDSAQLGRIKLRGRKFKVQNLINDDGEDGWENVWQEIPSPESALEYIPAWIEYAKKLKSHASL